MDSVFVTVGTTSFDKLIREVSSEKVTRILQDLGYRKLILQIGRGSVEPKTIVGTNFTLEVYRFKNSIADDIKNATLVISHAGAGSCLETLEAGKSLIVVINEELMNNHQLELAKQLHIDGHLLYCTCSTLSETLQKLDSTSLKPFPPGHPEKFSAFLDKVLGFQLYFLRVEKIYVALWRGGEMQKGVRKYFGQKSLNEVTMDEYLSSQGLYRKLTAKDGSCLFRTVSEQLFLTQMYHLEIRKTCIIYMRVNRSKFETFIDGPFDKHLERLSDPKEWAGMLEMSALSLMYNCDFLIYRYPGKSPTQATNNGFEKTILLCCSNNGHYDSVFTKQFQGHAAVCQAIVYEVLYRDVFGVAEEELRAAVELFRSHGKKTRKSSNSKGNGDIEYLPEKVVQKSDTGNSDQEGSPEEKMAKQSAEEIKNVDGPSKMPFPFKVLKALDSEIYRNVEFDVWLDSRKEQQKVDYMVVSGRQYCLGDKCQVKLEQGDKYYNAHIQEAGQDGNSVTVFIEELAEKHTVPLANLKPVTQVTPVPAWNIVSNRKGGNYQKIPSGYVSELDLDPKSRRRFMKKIRGKQVFMAFAYGRGQAMLPPRLQHSLPPGRSSLPPTQSGSFAPYDQYRVPPPTQRNGRNNYAPSRNQATRFVGQHGFVEPDYIYGFGSGKGCYQHYDNFTYRSRRSRKPIQYVNKDCQFGYVTENEEEPRATEESVSFYEIEEGNEAPFPVVHSQSASPPVLQAPAGYWVTRRGTSVSVAKHVNSSEDADEPSDGGEYHEDFIYAASVNSFTDSGYSDPMVYSATESTANLTIQEGCFAAESPQEGQVAAHFSYSQQMVNSSVVSTSSCSAPAAGFSSNSTETSQTSVTYTTVPSQTVASPVLVPAHPAGHPGPPIPVSEMAETVGSPTPPPPYSCDPNGNDLPRDRKVVQYYFNLGLQCCHQNYWHSVYMPQQQPVEFYPVFPAASQFIEQSTMPQPYGDNGRSDDHQGTSDTMSNGSYTTMEPQTVPHSTIYYPVLADQYIPAPAYDPCVPATSTLHYVGAWYPTNQMCNSSSRLQSPAPQAPVNYVGPANLPTHYVSH
ncbi:putative bifunctional UDP-N-acetylglucosamine transferase and deubiquitinase ALG13 [Stegostoma tigrinum]|uniref:putative bifunctional UDP-N-acetylglucosamine transferase and deubiquitinase ALG13 n=1 Tax=Stegostoma tigrinum TaxID=3053191 RepID=UPI00202AFE43|nr:putative bifunctional UDP-N-acetylglucosamine transferase and deubiquitinase ALG13 [Stegostoma tigrinum]